MGDSVIVCGGLLFDRIEGNSMKKTTKNAVQSRPRDAHGRFESASSQSQNKASCGKSEEQAPKSKGKGRNDW